MVRDTNEDKARFDLLIPKWVPYEEQLLTRVAMLMQRWAIKYEQRNREKAETREEYNRFQESLIRHMYQYLCWDTTEDHWAAIVFNLLWAETTLYKMSLLSNQNKNVSETKLWDDGMPRMLKTNRKKTLKKVL
jgi:hypothetical protein